ncbi:MAG: hypothetical protein NTY70_19720, partial [Burkholderiales bacterium]|nr:hypothetical protein [Burkholderiales bacterium]
PDISPTNELDVVPPLLSEEPELSVQKLAVDANSVDFGVIDFDFGSSDADVNAAPIENDAASLKAEVSEFKSASLVDENNLAFESSSPENSLDFSGLKTEPDLVMPTDNADAGLTSAPSAFEFDLSGINLDLGTDDLKLDIPVSVGDDVSAYNAEMATKLDLAVAYQEIGDKEGARELLDEVLKGGTLDQIEKAKAMLSQLI